MWGRYKVDLAPLGPRPKLSLGLASAAGGDGGGLTLLVKVADGWGQPARVLDERAVIAAGPVHLDVPLDAFRGRAVHLILEVHSRGRAPGAAWLLNPFVASA